MYYCEACGEPVPSEDFECLSDNPRYDESDVYIVHDYHKTVQETNVLEIIEQHGHLNLVRVDES